MTPSGSTIDVMGFNPHAKTKKGPADYAMVAAAVVVCLLLLAWALLG